MERFVAMCDSLHTPAHIVKGPQGAAVRVTVELRRRERDPPRPLRVQRREQPLQTLHLHPRQPRPPPYLPARHGPYNGEPLRPARAL